MMKNSKLSKLLVAGVSVAVLASAVAPMAFAEGEGSAAANEGEFTVYARVNNTAADTAFGGFNSTWTDEAGQYSHTFAVDDSTGIAKVSGTLKFKDVFTPGRTYKSENWKVLDPTNNLNDTQNVKLDYGVKDIPVQKLYDEYASAGNGYAIVSYDVEKRTDVVSVTWDYLTAPTVKAAYTKNGVIKGTDGYVYAIAADESSGVDFLFSDSVTLPEYVVEDANSYAVTTVTASDNSNDWEVSKVVKNGGTFCLDDLGLSKYLKGNPSATLSIDIETTVEAYPGVTLQLDVATNNASWTKDGKVTTAPTGLTLVGADAEDKGKVAYYTSAQPVMYNDKPVVLPNLVAKKADGSVDTEWTFSHWVVDSSCKAYLLADGETSVAGYAFKDGKFDANAFKATATPGDTALKLIPVFTKGPAAEKVVTYSMATTPNDEVIKYVNGVPEAAKVIWGIDTGFKGGKFLNEKTNTYVFYNAKDNNGRWTIDETFTDIADDIYFVKGVQDTGAYGLKSYSGAEGWNFLVANGEVARDYNGLWISPEGVWYYLTKGCCQIPAEGIFQNTKDDTLFHVFTKGKIDKTANGLKLYGDTWYNFVNGGCDTKAPTTVVEQDGAFFYVKAGVVDTTFSGEYEGHTFVNGWAAK